MTKKILLLILFISFLFTKLGYCPELPPSRARQIRTSTTNFDGNLGTDDINVQTALETIDDLALGASPWTDGGTELYPTNGEDVAIKGTGPDLTLQVTGGDTFGFHAETDLCFWKNDTDGEFYAEADTNHNLLLRPFTTDGKVGINLGHGTPTYNLQVGGTAYVSGTTTLNDLTVHSNSTVDLNSNRATEMGTPVVGTDGANKDYVDDVVEGASFDFFLNNTSSDIGIYFVMDETATGDPESSFSDTITNDDFLIDTFATSTTEPTFTTLVKGVYSVHLHADTTIGASTSTVRLYCEIYSRVSGGTETLRVTTEESSVLTSSKRDLVMHGTLFGDVELNATDRLVLKVYGNLDTVRPTNPVVTFYAEGTTASRMEVKTTISAFDDRYVEVEGDTMTGTLTLDGGADGVGQAFVVSFDGGGSAITANTKWYGTIPHDITLKSWYIVGDTSGAIKFDIWVDTFGTIPDNGDTITGGNEPEIVASGQTASSTDLSGWGDVTLTGTDLIVVNVDSITSITQATLTIPYDID